MATTKTSWSFDLISSAFHSTVLPNTKIWAATNQNGLSYQILVSWPFNWASPEEASGNALSMYVLDGNALGVTAIEAWRRRASVDPTQPDGIIISIGYPITDSVYSPQRNIDYKAWVPGQDSTTQPSAQDGADGLLDFIGGVLRPFIRSQFPQVNFTRDALYGHSLSGRFVIYALLSRPGLFDTYLAASPGGEDIWNKESIAQWNEKQSHSDTKMKPALRLAVGTLEAHPLKRRIETEEAYRARAEWYASFEVGRTADIVYLHLNGNPNLRDIELKVYPWSDHASLGAVGLTDGIDYFIDW